MGHKLNIFDYASYAVYLADAFELADSGRLTRAGLAQACRCHASLITQIIAGTRQLSLEQAFRAADYFGLGELERDYWLTLVQSERAGSDELRHYFVGRLDELRRAHQTLMGRTLAQDDVPSEAKQRYYSHWSYVAVHMMLTVARLGKVDAICRETALERAMVEEVLAFLVEHRLASRHDDGSYGAGPCGIHLAWGSPWLPAHHANWRLKALDVIKQRSHRAHDGRTLHYSVCFSLNRRDLADLRESLTELIASFHRTIEASEPTDHVQALCLDFFPVTHDEA